MFRQARQSQSFKDAGLYALQIGQGNRFRLINASSVCTFSEPKQINPMKANRIDHIALDPT